MFRLLVLVLFRHSVANLQDIDITVNSATPVFTVRGEGDGDVNYFLGIPYSQSRAPPKRFALPEEYVHAGGSVYEAKDQKHECVQSSGQGSEDCLYLDIYMPAAATPSNTKPVMVWIHGGSWMTGSKNEYSGKFWASQQWVDEVDRVLVVTVNYRMNIVGFPDLDNVPLNLGMHDTKMALTWVKNYIGDFGGDTGHTTIYGESAGSMLVLQLWATPTTDGLFQRAISQSPYVWNYEGGTSKPNEVQVAAKRARQESCLLEAKTRACENMTDGVANAGCTAQTPLLQDLVNSPSCFGSWYGPQSDGGVTISDTFYQDFCGAVNIGQGKELLVGFNALEVNLWSVTGAYPNKNAQMREWVEHLAPLSNSTSVFQCLGEMYSATGKMQNPARPGGGETEQERQDIYATNAIFFNMISQTLMQLPHVHMFMFNESAFHYGGQLCSNPLGAHACETPFVISSSTIYNMSNGIDNLNPVWAPMDTAIQQNMRRVWAHFALSGNPGWAHDEVGVFADNQLIINANGAVFDPSIKTLLNNLMCHPAAISPTCDIPHTYTCGEVKRLFRRNVCCGNPSRTFTF